MTWTVRKLKEQLHSLGLETGIGVVEKSELVDVLLASQESQAEKKCKTAFQKLRLLKSRSHISLDDDSVEGSEVNEVNDSVCLLFDSRERPGNNQYTASFSQLEQVLHQCANKVATAVQTKLLIGDYVWLNVNSGTLYNVTVERKTIGNLIHDSGSGTHLRQSRRMKEAFARPIFLLEGQSWKARERSLHLDNSQITSEAALYKHMANEAMSGVQFLESREAGATALLLAAISVHLSASTCSDGPFCLAGVAKSHGEKMLLAAGVNQNLQGRELERLDVTGKRRRQELDQILKSCDVSAADVDFATTEELQGGFDSFGLAPRLFSARFGLCSMVGRQMCLLAGASGFGEALTVETLKSGKRVSSQGLKFEVVVHHMEAQIVINMFRAESRENPTHIRAWSVAKRLRSKFTPGQWDVHWLVLYHMERDLKELKEEANPSYCFALIKAGLALQGSNLLVKEARGKEDGEQFQQSVLWLTNFLCHDDPHRIGDLWKTRAKQE